MTPSPNSATSSPASAENRFTRLLATRAWLLADGATGSNLFDAGLMSGDAPELWNIDQPAKITALHQSFVDAGADILLTNTFGGTRYRLKLHHSEGRVAELNLAAARLARAVADASGRDVAVAGSMGPTGEIMQPIGPLSIAQATVAFAEQAKSHGGAVRELVGVVVSPAGDGVVPQARAGVAEAGADLDGRRQAMDERGDDGVGGGAVAELTVVVGSPALDRAVLEQRAGVGAARG